MEREELVAPSPLELDALAETSNIGMGHAAMALSRIIGMEVQLEVPNLRILDPRQLAPPFPHAPAVGLSLEVQGVCASLLILLPLPFAVQIAGGGAAGGAATPFSEEETALICQGGSAVASAYLDAAGSLLRLTLSASPPLMECATEDAIAAAALERALAIDPPLVLQTVFSVPGLSGSGRILLIPGAEGVQAILTALGTR